MADFPQFEYSMGDVRRAGEALASNLIWTDETAESIRQVFRIANNYRDSHDHVSAQRKGVNLPDRFDQVPMMAQMQNIIDFPPAPKLDPLGRLDPTKATPQELAGRTSFFR